MLFGRIGAESANKFGREKKKIFKKSDNTDTKKYYTLLSDLEREK